jgi:hypothetical protein
MSVDLVAWAALGPRWRRFGGVGCGWGGALDWQCEYYALGMGVGVIECKGLQMWWYSIASGDWTL